MSMSAASACKLCTAVIKSVQRPHELRGRHEYIWDLGQALHNHGCPTCVSIAGVLRDEGVAALQQRRQTAVARRDWGPRSYAHSMNDQSVYREYQDDHSSSSLDTLKVCFYFADSRFEGCWHATLYSLNKEHLNCGIRLGFAAAQNEASLRAKTIDLRIIKRWARDCDIEHSGFCHAITDPWKTIPPATGLLLIDVERQCLVRQSEHCRYLALSYVWFNAEDQLRTTSANLETLMVEGASDLPHVRARLPQSVRDSLVLSEAVGAKFLWVDRFCIIQDDHATKHAQLAAMASIYVNAYFTIVSADAKRTDAGLTGIGPHRPREMPYRQFHFGPGTTMFQVDPILHDAKSKYSTRGWTYQEWILSPRRLVFHNQTVTWMCQEIIVEESGHEHVKSFLPDVWLPTYLDGEEAELIWTRWPNLYAYLTTIERYSMRELSFSEDVLNAFEAFITVQGRAMKGGMLHGLPELFFGSTLLWLPETGTSRRTDEHGNVLRRFPSWSWVGWVGQVHMNMTATVTNYVSRQDYVGGTFVDQPIIDFYKITGQLEDHVPRTKELIRDLHHYAKVDQYDQDTLLPCFENDYQGFTQNVPLLGQPETASLSLTSAPTVFIEFKTTRLFASLTVSPCIQHNLEQYPYIIDAAGAIVGYMDLTAGELPPIQASVELICIGLVKVTGMTCSEMSFRAASCFHSQCPARCSFDTGSCKLEPDWEFSFYNVLWVEWEDGVAYRKAIGKVWAVHWDTTPTEEVVVLLG